MKAPKDSALNTLYAFPYGQSRWYRLNPLTDSGFERSLQWQLVPFRLSCKPGIYTLEALITERIDVVVSFQGSVSIYRVNDNFEGFVPGT